MEETRCVTIEIKLVIDTNKDTYGSRVIVDNIADAHAALERMSDRHSELIGFKP